MNNLRDTLNKLDKITEDNDEYARLHNEYEGLYDAMQEFEEIQTELLELKERLSSAIRGYLPDSFQRWKAYGLAQLDVVAGGDEYMSNDESITDLIEECQERMEELKEEMQDAGVDQGEPEVEEESVMRPRRF